jgi:hypothetical protein
VELADVEAALEALAALEVLAVLDVLAALDAAALAELPDEALDEDDACDEPQAQSPSANVAANATAANTFLFMVGFLSAWWNSAVVPVPHSSFAGWNRDDSRVPAMDT